jgi:hypothetical protein
MGTSPPQYVFKIDDPAPIPNPRVALVSPAIEDGPRLRCLLVKGTVAGEDSRDRLIL